MSREETQSILPGELSFSELMRGSMRWHGVPTEGQGASLGTNRRPTTVGTEVGRPRRRSNEQNRNNTEASVRCGANRHRVETGVIWLKAHFIVFALIRLSATISLFTEHTPCVSSQELYHRITGKSLLYLQMTIN